MDRLNQTANPFPGLRPFDTHEARLFFGRDSQSDELLRRLGQSRFLAVVGVSGSGKSSLVRAGLLPSLRSGYLESARSRWRIALMRPGDDPIRNLGKALSASVSDESEPPNQTSANANRNLIAAQLRRSSRGLAEVAQHLGLRSHQKLLLVVDQFEEVFRFDRLALTGPEDTRGSGVAISAAFVALLLEAIHEEGGPVYVVLTMRADFLGDCSRFRGLPEALSNGQYWVPRLTRSQQREAIEGPLAVSGASATSALVQRLLNDAGDDPDQLPVLQHALMRTWDYWCQTDEGDQLLDVHHYEAIGTMASALSRHADDLYLELSEEERRIAMLMFKVLTERRSDNREVRRPASLEEICAVAGMEHPSVAKIVDQFRHPGVDFIVPPSTVLLTPETVLDISHESLIRLWGRLRSWVEEEAQSSAICLRLTQAARLHALGEVSLLRGSQLAVALEWEKKQQPNQAWAQRYGCVLKDAQDFLRRSQNRWSRRARWLRALAVTISVTFLLALGLTNYWAAKKQEELRAIADAAASESVTLRLEAERRENYAIARQLAAESSAQKRLDLALLLRVSARRFDSSFAERATLLSALQEHPAIVALIVPGDKEVVDTTFSPDGKTLVTLTADGKVVFWQVSTRSRQGAPIQGPAKPTSLAFSPDGKWLAIGSREGWLMVLDVVTKQPIEQDLSGEVDITSVAFTPDSKLLLAASEDETVGVWMVGDWRRKTTVGVGRKPMSLAVSPAGDTVAIGDDKGSIGLWSLQSWRPLGTPLQAHSGIVSSVSFSKNGRLLASGGTDRRVTVWELASRKMIGDALGHQDRVISVAFGAGNVLASGGADQSVMLWNARSIPDPTSLVMSLVGHQGDVTRVAFNADGNLIATSSRDRTVILWDLSSGRRLAQVLGSRVHPLSSVAFSPDGSLMAGGGPDDTLSVWDARTRLPIYLRLKANQEWINCIAFTPNSKILATGGNDGSVLFWDSLTGKPASVPLRAHGAAVTGLAFSSDGKLLATASSDRTIALWDTATGQLIGEPLRGHLEAVRALAFEPNGRILASGGADTSLILWDTVTRKMIGEPRRSHREAITSIAFAPKQSYFAVASEDETISLWDTKMGKLLGEPLLAGRGPVKSVALSPDGKMLASGNADETITLWDVEARRPHGIPLRQRDLNKSAGDTFTAGIASLAFSSNGRWLLSGSYQDSAVLWDVDLRSWLEQACSIANRNLTEAEWRRFVPNKPYARSCPTLPGPTD